MWQQTGTTPALRIPAGRAFGSYRIRMAIAASLVLATITLLGLSILPAFRAIEAGPSRVSSDVVQLGGHSVHVKNGETPHWIIELGEAQATHSEDVQPTSAGLWI